MRLWGGNVEICGVILWVERYVDLHSGLKKGGIRGNPNPNPRSVYLCKDKIEHRPPICWDQLQNSK